MITFRKADAEADDIWYVECYPGDVSSPRGKTDETEAPIITATVIANDNDDGKALLKAVTISPDWQKQGHEREINTAMQRKWPNLQYASADEVRQFFEASN